MGWFIELIRSFFFTIDSTLLNFIPFIYDILIKISKSSVLSQGNIQEIASRIQMLLGVFMLFKVTISLITYILNPDEFSDKGKGVSKLGFNIVFSLIVLVATPYIFNAAYDLQGRILSENALATLIFGDNVDDNDYLLSAGDQMAFDIMLPFFMPDSSLQGKVDKDYDLSSCGMLTDANDASKFNTECSKQMNYALKSDETDPNVMVLNYVGGYENKSLGLLFRLDIAKAKVDGTDNFLINYNAPITTVVAVVVLLLLITFCMDVALRSIKLAFLQLIAPIPIISYIDPKNGKDGLFKKWYQMCLTTYASLFVRLLALYFGIYIISIVGKRRLYDTSNNTLISDPLVIIFVIIGVLMFIKQLPKILEGLGIKLDSGSGKFTLNPFKKITEDAAGGKLIDRVGKGVLGAAGAVTSASVDKAVRFATSPGTKNKLAAINPLGLVGAAATGFAGGKGFMTGFNNQANVNRRLRESRVKGLSPNAAYLDYFGSKFGLDNATLEKESFYVTKSKDNAKKAKRDLENATLANSLEVDKLTKSGEVRKDTRSAIENVGKQTGRFIDKVDDFVNKKGNFNLTNNEMNAYQKLQNDIALAKSAGIKQIPVYENGHVVYKDIDEYELRENRRIMKRHYKDFRDSDQVNVKYLSENIGKSLNKSILVGDKYFAAGKTIDDDMVREAQNAKNIYIKNSQKDAVNDVNTYLEMSKLAGKIGPLTTEEQVFFNANKDFYDALSKANEGIASKDKYAVEFNSFKNISDEIEGSIKKANESIGRYNIEYGKNGEHLTDISFEINPADKNKATFYDLIKGISGDVESGNNITQINMAERELTNEIERLKAEIEKLRREKTTLYYDEDGRTKEISLDEFDKIIKLREEKLNDLINRHKELANIHESGKR